MRVTPFKKAAAIEVRVPPGRRCLSIAWQSSDSGARLIGMLVPLEAGTTEVIQTVEPD